MRVTVEHCPDADQEHAESRRQYCHVFHRPGVICKAQDFDGLPEGHRLGLLLHEVGHLLAGEEAGEEEADRRAQEYAGVPIHYQTTIWGDELQWVMEGDRGRARRALGDGSRTRKLVTVNPHGYTDPATGLTEVNRRYKKWKVHLGQYRPADIASRFSVAQGGGPLPTFWYYSIRDLESPSRADFGEHYDSEEAAFSAAKSVIDGLGNVEPSHNPDSYEPDWERTERWAHELAESIRQDRRGVFDRTSKAAYFRRLVRKKEKELAEHRAYLRSRDYEDDGIAIKMLADLHYWKRALELAGKAKGLSPIERHK